MNNLNCIYSGKNHVGQLVEVYAWAVPDSVMGGPFAATVFIDGKRASHTSGCATMDRAMERATEYRFSFA